MLLLYFPSRYCVKRMLKRVDFFCSCYKKRSGGDESAESRGVPSEPLNWDGTSYHKLKAKEMLTFLFAPHMEKKEEGDLSCHCLFK